MSGFEIHKEAENADRVFAPLGPSQTYEMGDPVYLLAEQLTASPADASPVEDGQFIGFAAEPASGTTAGSRATNAANGFGAAEDQMRAYIPGKASGLLLKTRNYWTTPGTQIAKNGNIVGELHQISAVDATDVWGVESTAGGDAADAVAFIVAILDDDGNPVGATTALTAGEGWVIFRMVGVMQGDVLAGG